jgi:DNA-directed RNA polymerase specialized sigma24 family protein
MLEAYRDFERFQGHSEQEWLAWLRKILNHNAADFVRRYRGTATYFACGRCSVGGSREACSAAGTSL